MKNGKTVRVTGIWLALMLLFLPQAQGDELGEKVEKPVGETIAIRQKSQVEDEKWREKQQQLVMEMELLEAAVTELRAEKAELVAVNLAAKERIGEKEQKLASIEQIKEQMEPFIVDLVAEIKASYEGGLPFLVKERKERIAKLEATLYDPEIALSEKFRKAMEALQIEMEYGLTIETYQQQIAFSGEQILVDIFRLGRLGLYFQTLDQSRCGLWDQRDGIWLELPESYNYDIQKAIEIAAKRRPAELVTMPLGRLVKVVEP